MKPAKAIVDQAIEHRRDMQYNELIKWGNGRISGTECIENILELDKLIPVNFQEARKLRGKDAKK